MPCSSQIILSETLPEIHTMEKGDFLKSIIDSQKIYFLFTASNGVSHECTLSHDKVKPVNLTMVLCQQHCHQKSNTYIFLLLITNEITFKQRS